jgi:hypothetical protein
MAEKYSHLGFHEAFKTHGAIGQLSRKLEAAGKVRVFAMVDI